MNRDVVERFLGRAPRGGPDECWIWTRETNNKGYGRFELWKRGKRRRFLAHRVAYEVAYGPIPDGLVVMHTCDTPPCVNPVHLTLGTQVDNIHDMHKKGRADITGLAIGRALPPVTQCKYGHEYTSENTFINSKGYRECRTCRSQRHQRRKMLRQQRAAVAA